MLQRNQDKKTEHILEPFLYGLSLLHQKIMMQQWGKRFASLHPPPGPWIHWEHSDPLSVPPPGACQQSSAVKPGKTVSEWIEKKGALFQDSVGLWVPLLGVLAAVSSAVVVRRLKVSGHDCSSCPQHAPALRGGGFLCVCTVQNSMWVFSPLFRWHYYYMSYLHCLVGV